MNLSDFLPYVLPHAPGLSSPMAQLNIRLAIIELCRKALIWRAYQTRIIANGLTTSFSYTPVAGQQVVKLLSLTFNDVDIRVVDPELGKRLDNSVFTDAYAYGGFSGFELRPAQTGDIVTYSVVAPSLAATTVPDEFARYAEDIGRGALWRVQATAGKEYSNKAEAVINKSLWEESIDSAKTDAFIGFSRTAPRVRASWM